MPSPAQGAIRQARAHGDEWLAGQIESLASDLQATEEQLDEAHIKIGNLLIEADEARAESAEEQRDEAREQLKAAEAVLRQIAYSNSTPKGIRELARTGFPLSASDPERRSALTNSEPTGE